MKRLFATLFISFALVAAVLADDCILPLGIYIKEDPTISTNAAQLMEKRLEDIIVKTGVTTSLENCQFAVCAHPIILDHDVAPSAQTRVVMIMELTLSAADMYAQKVINTETIKLKGVGRNNEQAMLDAVKQLRADNAQMVDFVAQSKRKIVSYYDSQADYLIMEAQRFAATSQYDKAIYMLLQIPTCCQNYAKVNGVALDIFQEYLNYNCAWALNEARRVWAAGQTEETARYVVSILNSIDPKASCNADVDALMAEIKAQVRSDIDFEEREKYRDSVELQKMALQSMTQVGVAYGTHQQPNTTNFVR